MDLCQRTVCTSVLIGCQETDISWGGITFDGRTPLIFIPQGFKVNQAVYRDLVLKKVVKPWAKKIFQLENGHSSRTLHLSIKQKQPNSLGEFSRADFQRNGTMTSFSHRKFKDLLITHKFTLCKNGIFCI